MELALELTRNLLLLERTLTMRTLMLVCFACLAVFLSSCEDNDNTGSLTSGNSETSETLKTDWPLAAEDAKALQEKGAKRLGIPRFSRLDLGDSVSIRIRAPKPCRLLVFPRKTIWIQWFWFSLSFFRSIAGSPNLLITIL